MRLLRTGPLEARASRPAGFDLRRVDGGLLVQSRDVGGDDFALARVVTRRAPTEEEMAGLRFAWAVCRHVKSNAVVIAKTQAAVGIGGGQVDRVSAARIAIQKAGERARGAVAASDAFFPFPDGPQLLLESGATAIIQPGGAMKDQETIDVVNRAGAAMVFTGQRHFKH